MAESAQLIGGVMARLLGSIVAAGVVLWLILAVMYTFAILF